MSPNYLSQLDKYCRYTKQTLRNPTPTSSYAPSSFLDLLNFEMAPSVSWNFISLVTSCVRVREEEPQTAFPVSFTWASHIGAIVLMGSWTLPNQSIHVTSKFCTNAKAMVCPPYVQIPHYCQGSSAEFGRNMGNSLFYQLHILACHKSNYPSNLFQDTAKIKGCCTWHQRPLLSCRNGPPSNILLIEIIILYPV